MRSYILRRLLLMIPTLIGISLVCFILIQLLPGGPVEEMISRAQQAAAMKGGVDASKALSPDQISQIQAYFGFDQPAWKRYLTWLWNVLHLDLGSSYTYGLPVWDVIVSRFPISLFRAFICKVAKIGYGMAELLPSLVSILVTPSFVNNILVLFQI